MKKKEICKNCEKWFKSSFKFCPHCGQQAKVVLTVKVLFYNTIHNYFSFDARFYKSFFPLLFKPGYLAIKFNEGKRLMYLHPAQMYLFVTVVFFFLFSFVQNEQVKYLDDEFEKTIPVSDISKYVKPEKALDSMESRFVINEFLIDPTEEAAKGEREKELHVIANFSEKRLSKMLDSDKTKHNGILSIDFDVKLLDSMISVKAPKEAILIHMGMSDDPGYIEKRFYTQALRFYETRKGGRVLQAFYDAIPFAMFFLLPIFALILKSLYYKRGLYAEYLVFSFYYFSFIFMVLGLMLLVYFFFNVSIWIEWICFFLMFLYLVFAIKNFYKQSWFLTIVKTFIVSFVFLSIVIPITVATLSAFAFLFY
ncbi:DUF3667 domain-containing protein [Tamlana haliotis]|uniref:DUF3667 domain-containing protein n=1 Tax=Pseudotamlana haliotis TaxID=2614804 RepID=A0A6N6MS22_9FLAO|nr:DUF3667 domain-containing protein [Tamlana haliotis]KAB1071407.1 DUF3667 domain-containing protein [Tamlana haliotis]